MAEVSGRFKPGNKIGIDTRWKPGDVHPKQKKPSLLKEMERLAARTKTVALPGVGKVEMSFLELAALAYWKKCLKGNFQHLKLLLGYFDGQPPQAPDPSQLRTPEDNARLIMAAVREMNARNNGHNGNGASNRQVVSSTESPGDSGVLEERSALQRGPGGSEVVQDGDGEEEGNQEGPN